MTKDEFKQAAERLEQIEALIAKSDLLISAARDLGLGSFADGSCDAVADNLSPEWELAHSDDFQRAAERDYYGEL